jgi:hypothetical protein
MPGAAKNNKWYLGVSKKDNGLYELIWVFD